MRGRIAPKNGYDFGNKRQYRRDVWAAFSRFCGTERYRSHALLMPSSEGDEIDVALANGFREHNLHVVDNNPAIVAHLKRRWPKITTYGVDVASACRRISRSDVKLDVANFDLTGCVCEQYFDVLARCAGTGAVDNCAVAVTFQRGRERGWQRAMESVAEIMSMSGHKMLDYPASSLSILLRQLIRRHRGSRNAVYEILSDQTRAFAVLTALSAGVEQKELWNRNRMNLHRPLDRIAEILRFESYKSGNSNLTMGWVLAFVHTRTDEDLSSKARTLVPTWVIEELRAEGALTPRTRITA